MKNKLTAQPLPPQRSITRKIISLMEIENELLSAQTGSEQLSDSAIEKLVKANKDQANIYAQGICFGLSTIHAIYLMNDEAEVFYDLIDKIDKLTAVELRKNAELMNFVNAMLLMLNIGSDKDAVLGYTQRSITVMANILGFDDITKSSRSWLHNPSTDDLYEFLKKIAREKMFRNNAISIGYAGHATTLNITENGEIHYYDPNRDKVLKFPSDDEGELLTLATLIKGSHSFQCKHQFAYFDLITKTQNLKEKKLLHKTFLSLTQIPPQKWEDKDFQGYFATEALDFNIDQLDSEGFDTLFRNLNRIRFKKLDKDLQEKIGFIALLLGKTDFIVKNEVFSNSFRNSTVEIKHLLDQMVSFAEKSESHFLKKLLSETHILGLNIDIDESRIGEPDLSNIVELISLLPTKLATKAEEGTRIHDTISQNNLRVDKLCTAKQILDIQAVVTSPQTFHPPVFEEVEMLYSGGNREMFDNTLNRWTKGAPSFANKQFRIKYHIGEEYYLLKDSRGQADFKPLSEIPNKEKKFFSRFAHLHLFLSSKKYLNINLTSFLSLIKETPNHTLESFFNFLIAENLMFSGNAIPFEILKKIKTPETPPSKGLAVFLNNKDTLKDNISELLRFNRANPGHIKTIVIDDSILSNSPEELLARLYNEDPITPLQLYLYDKTAKKHKKVEIKNFPSDSFKTFFLSQKERLTSGGDTRKFEAFASKLFKNHILSKATPEIVFNRLDFICNHIGDAAKLSLTLDTLADIESNTRGDLLVKHKDKITPLIDSFNEHLETWKANVESVEPPVQISRQEFSQLERAAFAMLIYAPDVRSESVEATVSRLSKMIDTLYKINPNRASGLSKKQYLKDAFSKPTKHFTSAPVSKSDSENTFFKSASFASSLLKKGFFSIEQIKEMLGVSWAEFDEILSPYENLFEYCIYENRADEYLSLVQRAGHPGNYTEALSTTHPTGRDLLNELLCKTKPVAAVKLIKSSKITNADFLKYVNEEYQSGILNQEGLNDLLKEWLRQSQADSDALDAIQTDGLFVLLKEKPSVLHIDLRTVLQDYLWEVGDIKLTNLVDTFIKEDNLHLLFEQLDFQGIASCLSTLSAKFKDEQFFSHQFLINTPKDAQKQIALFNAFMKIHHTPSMVTDWLVKLASNPSSSKHFEAVFIANPETRYAIESQIYSKGSTFKKILFWVVSFLSQRGLMNPIDPFEGTALSSKHPTVMPPPPPLKPTKPESLEAEKPQAPGMTKGVAVVPGRQLAKSADVEGAEDPLPKPPASPRSSPPT